MQLNQQGCVLKELTGIKRKLHQLRDGLTVESVRQTRNCCEMIGALLMTQYERVWPWPTTIHTAE